MLNCSDFHAQQKIDWHGSNTRNFTKTRTITVKSPLAEFTRNNDNHFTQRFSPWYGVKLPNFSQQDNPRHEVELYKSHFYTRISF